MAQFIFQDLAKSRLGQVRLVDVSEGENRQNPPSLQERYCSWQPTASINVYGMAAKSLPRWRPERIEAKTVQRALE